MAGYCLKDGRLREYSGTYDSSMKPQAIFHLTADGGIEETDRAPGLEAGEGLLMYGGDFYIEPLEIQIEFLKSANAEKWLTALILRHTERVRQIPDSLWAAAEMREVGA